MKHCFRFSINRLHVFDVNMKSQKTALLLGSMTVGIVMVLLVIDFVTPSRSTLKPSGLVAKGRMSLFGEKTTPGRFMSLSSTDKLDIIKERMNTVNRKLDRTLDILRDIRFSRDTAMPMGMHEGLPMYTGNAIESHPYYAISRPYQAKPAPNRMNGFNGEREDVLGMLDRPDIYASPSSTEHYRRVGAVPSTSIKGFENIIGHDKSEDESGTPSDENFEKLIGELFGGNVTGIASKPKQSSTNDPNVTADQSISIASKNDETVDTSTNGSQGITAKNADAADTDNINGTKVIGAAEGKNEATANESDSAKLADSTDATANKQSQPVGEDLKSDAEGSNVAVNTGIPGNELNVLPPVSSLGALASVSI